MTVPAAQPSDAPANPPDLRERVWDVLRTIPDPEMPISIVDLGIVEAVEAHEGVVQVTVLPTFVGCPALGMIEDDIKSKVGAVEGVDEVGVRFVFDPPWSTDRITEVGRAELAAHGVTVPEGGGKLEKAGDVSAAGPAIELRVSALACPFCGSSETRLESPFGPTRCRMIYYCDSCRNTFEHMKRV
jgi:ring-1,2-phenylacetyl-CoA epoxidase subunit PaaD